MAALTDNKIPLLTDIVAESSTDTEDPSDAQTTPFEDLETVIAELQTKIASRTFALTDDLMREAFAEMEATVFRQISARLREQLPELIDTIIREQLQGDQDD